MREKPSDMHNSMNGLDWMLNNQELKNDDMEKRHITRNTRQNLRYDIENTNFENSLYLLLREEMGVYVKFALMNYFNVTIKSGEIYSTINKICNEVCSKPDLVNCLLDIKSIDYYTYKQSINVTVLSIVVAFAYGIRGKELYKLGLGALFHDIGKINIPRQILLSSVGVNDDDRVEIQKHTEWGYEYLIRINNLPEEVAIISLQHHERFNGTGYPYKLETEGIHLYSAIVGIADVYEAMISERTYRKGYNPVEIIEFFMAAGGDYLIIIS